MVILLKQVMEEEQSIKDRNLFGFFKNQKYNIVLNE